MMRVLYVQPGQGIGGAKISLLGLLRYAPEGQISQVVLTLPEEDEYVQMLGGSVEKAHFVWLPTWHKRKIQQLSQRIRFGLSRLKRGWYLWPTLQLARIIHREHINLVHTNNSITPVGAFAARLTDRPHIWHVREPLGRESPFSLAPGDPLSAWLFQKLSQAIVCNSEHTAQFFEQQGLHPRVIYNGIDLAAFENAQARGCQLRDQLGFRDEELVVGMVASLRSSLKEHGLFLQAAALLYKQFPGCRFVVFGGSTDLEATPYTHQLRETAHDLQIADRLTWVGFIADVPAMMHSLDILVHPTSQEGSGRVVMEAMAAGKPVVGVNAGGVQELIHDGETGFLVPAKDAQALSQSAKLLLEDEDLSRRMGAQAKAYARKHFSHEQTSASIHALYQEVLAQKYGSQ